MFRDHDPREHEHQRPDLNRVSRVAGDVDDRLAVDARDVLVRDLDLPRGRERERVCLRSRSFTISGSEARALASVGAFRVVPAADLRDDQGRPLNAESHEIRHLNREGLIRTMPYVIGRGRTTLVTLTEAGRDLLEASRRDHDLNHSQTFYAGMVKPRELSHDAQFHRAYVRAAERLTRRGVRVRRVVLDYELKRDYQRFLHRTDRPRHGGTADRQRTSEEIAQWAREHALPVIDGHVQFPDVRIEYDERDGQRGSEDVEVMTPHYRGALAAAKRAAGFTRYRGVAARIGGSGGGGSRGRGGDARLAEEVLQ